MKAKLIGAALVVSTFIFSCHNNEKNTQETTDNAMAEIVDQEHLK
ncbi:MAG TPA: hypothetical protein VLR49_13760 [Ferruginibacter sp.]|nr:hypothetical protein [Ferruginibacter sp.]